MSARRRVTRRNETASDRVALSGTVVASAPPEKGTIIRRTSIRFTPGANAPRVPVAVDNWTTAEGALLFVAIERAGSWRVEGSAVMIGMGLAVTAKHVIDENALAELLAGTARLLLGGPTSAGIELWTVRKVTRADTDVSFLSVIPATVIRDGWNVRTWPCSARVPTVGERVHLFGFRIPHEQTQPNVSGGFTASGSLYHCTGVIEEFYFPRRDSFMVTFPAFQIGCSSLPAMSGGAIVNNAGRLIGIISTGMSTGGSDDYSIGAWLIPGAATKLSIDWPEGCYANEMELWEIPEQLFELEGREWIFRDSQGHLLVDPSQLSHERDGLRQHVETAYGVSAEWLREVPRQTMAPVIVWNGPIQVFRISGHTTALLAYAWFRKDADGTVKRLAVLHGGDIQSGEDALKLA